MKPMFFPCKKQKTRGKGYKTKSKALPLFAAA